MAKRIAALLLALTCLLGLSACGQVRKAETVKVGSALYSEFEIRRAIAKIKRDFFFGWDGCELLSIRYAGDSVTLGYRDWAQRYGKDQVIVLISDFYARTPAGNSGLTEEQLYGGWNWILVRNEHGAWRHVDHGF